MPAFILHSAEQLQSLPLDLTGSLDLRAKPIEIFAHQLTVSYYYCTYLSRYCIAYATIITLTKLKVQTRRAVWRSSHSCWVEAPSGKDLTG
jgi:hypothetical protein